MQDFEGYLNDMQINNCDNNNSVFIQKKSSQRHTRLLLWKNNLLIAIRSFKFEGSAKINTEQNFRGDSFYL